jgi:hypothetical protein
MERLKPLFPLDPRFNQGRNQYRWEPRGKVTGYASLLSPCPPPLVPPPPQPAQKTKKTSRNSWRKTLKTVGRDEVTSWRWKVIRLFLCGWFSVGAAQKCRAPICPFSHNTFSFISSIVFLLRSYSIQFLSFSLLFAIPP